MANLLYPKGKEALLKADIDLENDDIRAVLYDTNAVAYNAAHDFLDDVSAAIVGTAVALTSKTFTNGVFDAADTTLTAVSGDVCEAILIYKHTGTASTSPLIALIDTATGLPVTPNGGNILIAWDNGANKIFAL